MTEQALHDTIHPRPLKASSTPYTGRIWDVVSQTFALTEDGPTMTRDFISHPGAVAIVPMDDQGRVLLLRQYRHPVGMDMWEIPAGLLDVEGEGFVAAAARELAEEADLTATDWRILVDFFNSPGSSSEAIRVFLATGLSLIPEEDRHVRTEEESEIEFSWVTVEDAVSLILAGQLHNPSAIAGILALSAALERGLETLRPGEEPWPAHPRHR